MQVAGEHASLLGAAGVAAFNTSVNDGRVQAMVAPQFHPPLSAESNTTNLVRGCVPRLMELQCLRH